MKNIIVLLLPVFFISCDMKQDVQNFDSFLQDAVYLPFGMDNAPLSIYQLTPDGNNIGFLQWQDLKYSQYNLTSKVLIEQRNIILNNHNFANAAFAGNLDSLYLLLRNNKIALQRNNEIVTWDLSTIVNDINPDGNILNSDIPLYVNNDTVTAVIYPSFDMELLDYLKNMRYVVFKLDTNNQVSRLAYVDVYRNSFFSEQGYYASFLAPLGGLKYIQTYASLDSIYMLDLKTNNILAYSMQTDLMKNNEPFDITKNRDAGYQQKYAIENSLISNIMYNGENNFLYLFIKHAATFLDEDGTKGKYNDCPFSLLVYDSNFKKTKEIFIPAKTIGFTYLTFFKDNKLYIPANESKQDKENETKFYIVDTNF